MTRKSRFDVAMAAMGSKGIISFPAKRVGKHPNQDYQVWVSVPNDANRRDVIPYFEEQPNVAVNYRVGGEPKLTRRHVNSSPK